MGNSESQDRGAREEKSWTQGLDCYDTQGFYAREGRSMYHPADCCDDGAATDRSFIRAPWQRQEDHQSHHHEQNGHHISVLGLRKQAEEIKRLEREIAQVSICHVHVVYVERLYTHMRVSL